MNFLTTTELLDRAERKRRFWSNCRWCLIAGVIASILGWLIVFLGGGWLIAFLEGRP